MGVRLEIKCVEKTDSKKSSDRISYIGGFFPDGKFFKFTIHQAIEFIESNTYDFFVTYNGKELLVYVAYTIKWAKFLKTENDWELPISLLNLPKCP